MSRGAGKDVEISKDLKEKYMGSDDDKSSESDESGDYEVSRGFNTADDDEPEVWNSGLEVMDDPAVIVPEKVRRVCVALQEEVGYNEFGVLFKGEWTKNGFEVKPDFVVPDQEVSTATVQYDEDLKKYRDQGYIVNAHSHPMSGKSAGFSGVDDDHVNSHFDVALLYGGQDDIIAGASANIEVCDGGYIQIEPRVEREPRIEETVDELEKVRNKMERLGIDEAVDLLDRVEEIDTDLPDVDADNIDIRGSRERRTGRGAGKSSYKVPSKHERSDYERRKSSGGVRGAGKQVRLDGDEADEEDLEKTVDEIESSVHWGGYRR